jgi:outer membrane lipoprotein-sorting protein
MNNIFYLLITLSLVAYSATAQNDPKAKKILDEVSSRLKSYKGINAGFSLISKSRAGKINNNAAGKILIKGNKYYIRQGAVEIFSDGNKTWNYNGNDEVTVTPVDNSDNALTPQTLFTNFYDKDYTYRLVSSAGNFDEIQLVPNDKRKNFKQLNAFVDKAKMIITRAKIIDKSNNTIDLKLSNINTGANIPDDTFVFNKSKYKKNIEVIE